MTLPQSAIYQRKMRGVAYTLNFILSLQIASISYYVANFLRELGLSMTALSAFFMLMAMLSLFAFMLVPQWFRRFGVGRTLGVAAIVYSACFVLLAGVESFWVQLAALLFSAVPSAVFVAALDTTMEVANTDEQDTGTQRGIFLTMANIAFLAGPLLGGQLVGSGDFRALWLGSVALLLPAVFLIVSRLRLFPARVSFRPFRLRHLWQLLLRRDWLRYSFIMQFFLYVFYSVMVLYTSVYLREYFRFDYTQVSYTFFLMLLPFVVLTMPVARLADRYWGEKEFLVVGFVIMGLATIAFGLATSPSWIVMTGLLVLTRIGATLVATASESYFFKHVDGTDTDETVAFRALYPLANIIGPLFAGAVFAFGSYATLFVLLGVLVLCGAVAAVLITDTR